MKSHNLHGEYCQGCAAILDDVQRNHRRIIVLDSQCLAQFQQSGDAARLDEAARREVSPAQVATESLAHDSPPLPMFHAKQESEEMKETVQTKTPKAAKRGKK